MDRYSNFISQIPKNVMTKVETHFCSNIAVFKPQVFIGGASMVSDDFHIIIPSVTPPDTYINDKLRSFQMGKIVAVNPGDTVGCVKGHSSKPYYAILIKPELINKIAKEMGHSGDVRFLKLQNAFSRDLLYAVSSFEKEVQHPDSIPLLLDSLSVQIAALLLREFKTNLKKYPSISPDSNVYVNLAIEYMQTFYSSNITISDICEAVNLSPFHFIRTFKQKTGISPYKYLLNIRIKKAEELLVLGKHSVAEVAMLCGFINPSHFSSKFKEITGQSPSKYKKISIKG